jgi:hypothetical protein
MSGTKIVLDKNGGCHALYTADGHEIEGVLCNSAQLTQTTYQKAAGMVVVQLEVMVYESDLSTTGKFDARQFIKKVRPKNIR